MGVALLIIVGWLGPLLVPARGGVEALVLPAVLCPLLLYSPLRNNSILFNVSRIFICHSADSSISLSIRSTFILSSISSSSFPMRLCFSFKVASKEYSFADTSVLKHPSDVSYDFLNLVRELRSYRSISTPDMDKPFELRIIFASFCGHRSSSGSKHFFTNAYQVGRQLFECVSQRDSCFDKCIYIFNTTEHRHKATCLLVRGLAASRPHTLFRLTV